MVPVATMTSEGLGRLGECFLAPTGQHLTKSIVG